MKNNVNKTNGTPTKTSKEPTRVVETPIKSSQNPEIPLYMREVISLIKRCTLTKQSADLIPQLDVVDLKNAGIQRYLWKGYEYSDAMLIVTITWAEIIRQDFPKLYGLFKCCLLKEGMPKMIQHGSESHLEWVSGKNINHIFFSQLPLYVDDLSLKKIATAMKYPNRFSANSMNEDCLYEFIDEQKLFKNTNVHTVRKGSSNMEYYFPWILIDKIRGDVIKDYKFLTGYYPRVIWDELKDVTRHFFFTREWSQLGMKIWKYCKNNKLPVPSGSCADTKKSLYQKITKLEAFEQQIAKCKNYDQFKALISSKMFERESVHLITVPKNYKSRRLIATVPVVCQSIGMVVQKCVLQILEKSYNERSHKDGVVIAQQNQHLARNAAQEGSNYLRIDTIDQSHASDRILYNVIRDLIPERADLRFWLVDIVPRKAHYRDKKGHWCSINLTTFAPAGYANTFNMECMYFAWITMLSKRMCNIFDVGQSGDDWFVTIVGDDISCKCEYTETIIDLLVLFGAKVNEDKTFKGEAFFRESCGGDYMYGLDVTPLYFPRKQWNFQLGVSIDCEDVSQENVDEFSTTFTSMCSLARRLYDYPLAQNCVVAAIEAVKGLPTVTMSAMPEETGIRSVFHEVTSHFKDNYRLFIKNKVAQGPTSTCVTTNNGEKARLVLQADVDLYFDYVKVGDRRFIAPTIRDTVRNEYMKYRRGQQYDENILTANMRSAFDRYMYDYYLCYGPDDSDDILKKSGVTLRREL